MVEKIGQRDRSGTKWFYTNLPEDMGVRIDQILDKKGNELALFSRKDYILYALREQMKRDLISIRVNSSNLASQADEMVSGSQE